MAKKQSNRSEKREKNRETYTDQEKKEWDDLFQYVRKNVMHYSDVEDENGVKQTLSTNMVWRLKGMRTGKFMEDRSVDDIAKYPFSIIQIAFMVSMPKIESAFHNATFDNEMHKFNLACKIAEEQLNDVYERMKKKKRMEEAEENFDASMILYDGASYTKKTEETQDSLKDLW